MQSIIGEPRWKCNCRDSKENQDGNATGGICTRVLSICEEQIDLKRAGEGERERKEIKNREERRRQERKEREGGGRGVCMHVCVCVCMLPEWSLVW
jgi:hypothetical protein